MKRIWKILIAFALTIVGYMFLQNVLDVEVEPYYVLALFILIASGFGLYDRQK